MDRHLGRLPANPMRSLAEELEEVQEAWAIGAEITALSRIELKNEPIQLHELDE